MGDAARLGKGFVHLYTGDGKGKTTAALGLCFRAAGHGLKSLVVQFVKGDRTYGENAASERSGGLITITAAGRGVPLEAGRVQPRDIELAAAGLALARERMTAGAVDLVVLDEICPAVNLGLVSAADVQALIEAKPEGVELVLTGRNAPRELVKAADLVTECLMIRHYFEIGLQARTGIEV